MSNKFDTHRFSYYLSRTLANDITLADTYDPQYLQHLRNHLNIGPDTSKTSIERKLNEFILQDYKNYYGESDIMEIRRVPTDYWYSSLLLKLCKIVGCLIEVRGIDGKLIPQWNLPEAKRQPADTNFNWRKYPIIYKVDATAAIPSAKILPSTSSKASESATSKSATSAPIASMTSKPKASASATFKPSERATSKLNAASSTGKATESKQKESAKRHGGEVKCTAKKLKPSAAVAPSKDKKLLDMPLDFDFLSEPQSSCSSSANVAEQDLALSSSSSDVEFIDDDEFTSAKREKFQEHLKKLAESEEFKSCQSYINKLQQQVNSMARKFKVEPKCAMCIYHCFSVLDDLSKNPSGRPSTKK